MSTESRHDVTERDVAAVVKKYVPGLACERIRFLAVSDFSTWEVDDRFIVRFAFNEGSGSQLALEVAALPVLAAHLPVSVPQVEFIGATVGGRPVVGYPKLLGTDGEHFRPPPKSRTDLVNQFAAFLLALQGLDPGSIDHEIPEWAGPDLDTPLEQIGKYAPLIAEQEPDLVTAELARYLRGEVPVPVRPATRVLSHADLKGEHLLFDAARCRLTSVLDWADMSISDPAVDLGYLAIWLGPRFMAEVGKAMGASSETINRALFGIRSYMLIGLGATLAGERHWPLELVRTQIRWAFAEDGGSASRTPVTSHPGLDL